LHGRFLTILHSDLPSACVDVLVFLGKCFLIFSGSCPFPNANVVFLGVFNANVNSLPFSFVNLSKAFALRKGICVKEDRHEVVVITCAWFEVFPVYTKPIVVVMSGRKFFNNACVSEIVELRGSLKPVIDAAKVTREIVGPIMRYFISH
jgi:hypothetical protein